MSVRSVRILVVAGCLSACAGAWAGTPSENQSVVPSGNQSEKILPLVLESWAHRVDLNKGVHNWGRENDGIRIFQEWIALLTRVRDSSAEVKKRTGLALEKYVVKGN